MRPEIFWGRVQTNWALVRKLIFTLNEVGVLGGF